MSNDLDTDYDKAVEQAKHLADMLGRFGSIERVTMMPSGLPETDSHHSFALALIAYEMAKTYEPQLDANLVLKYGLVHDLPELTTGDVNTLLLSTEQLKHKEQQDAKASKKLKTVLKAPYIFSAVEEFELLADDESHYVYWFDKMMTILSHFFDDGKNLRDLGITKQSDIDAWKDRLYEKLARKAPNPPNSARQIFELLFDDMRNNLGLK